MKVSSKFVIRICNSWCDYSFFPLKSQIHYPGGEVTDRYTREELEEALQIVSTTISRCEKTQPKFAEGTSQHTLLKNRIKALYISKSLITGESVIDKYTKEELTDALRPISSIISKCEKAQQKHAEGTPHHTRFKNIIKAMYISKSLVTEALEE